MFAMASAVTAGVALGGALYLRQEDNWAALQYHVLDRLPYREADIRARGYKGFEVKPNGGFSGLGNYSYVLGHTYTHDGPVHVCYSGLHYGTQIAHMTNQMTGQVPLTMQAQQLNLFQPIK